SLELNPQLIEGFDLFHQSGRDGLAAIDRLRYSTFVKLPYGDENEYVSLGYTRANYIPTQEPSLQGNILSAGFGAKEWDRLYLTGQANLEEYRDRLKDRVTFDTLARYDFCDYVKLRAGLYLQNVVENGETLNQDIYRYGTRVGTD